MAWTATIMLTLLSAPLAAAARVTLSTREAERKSRRLWSRQVTPRSSPAS